MAVLSNSRTFALSGPVRLFGLMFASVAEWNDVRVTRKALSRLSLRELDDLGLTPSDIDDVARGRRAR